MNQRLTPALLRASWHSWMASDLSRVGPYWLQPIWTLLFACAMALGFTLLGYLGWGRHDDAWSTVSGWARWYGRNLIVCATIGFTVHGLFETFGALIGGAERLRRFKPWQRLIFFAGTPILGVLIGWPLGLWLAGAPVMRFFTGEDSRRIIIGSALLILLLNATLYAWFSARTQQILSARQASEAQLRLLQAQMEPHFMFNTLANVLAQMDSEPAQAKRMLEAFTEYLRASLGQMRQPEASLGSEVDLAERYLQLMRLRMEDRLRYRLAIAPELRATPLPSLLLQPLVENAIHHGLEPQVEGGEILLSARRDGQHIVIEVQDDGRGLAAPARKAGNGVALANLRERLGTRYAGAASLELQALAQGTLVRLRLPVAAA